jgi:hypothetical protein
MATALGEESLIGKFVEHFTVVPAGNFRQALLWLKWDMR